MPTGKAKQFRGNSTTAEEAQKIAETAIKLGLNANVRGFRNPDGWNFQTMVFVEGIDTPWVPVQGNDLAIKIALPELWSAINK